MKSIFARVFGAGKRLSALEVLVLNAVRAKLDETNAALWDRQIMSINKVQRLPGGLEVDFYRMKGGSLTCSKTMAFANRGEEMLIAEVTVSIGAVGRKITALVWAVHGVVFSIEYDGNPEYVEEAMGMSPPLAMTVVCDIKSDPSASASQ